jgi:eukaryotic-like serine/threonine-protein kinase
VQQAPALAKVCPRCRESFSPEAAFCPNDGARLLVKGDEDPYLGAVIAGDIEIRVLAGAGAMGRVYRGYQRGTQRDVAVKILHGELSGRKQLVQRFHREAKIAGKLHHPHVVDVYFTGELPDGALYIVMEYLDGASLAAALQAAGGRMSLERALGIGIQIAEAMGEGHKVGIVHRDIKPENVMLVVRGDTPDWVKVLDFGIARATLPDESMETAAGAVFGTARYISPEGAQGGVATPASDVYSLGVMLYQMLAGRTPFDSEQAVGLLVKHVHEPPPPLRSLPEARHLPEGLERLVMDSLAKDPAQRAPDGRALAAALHGVAHAYHIHLPHGMGRPSLALVPPYAVPQSRAPSPPSVVPQSVVVHPVPSTSPSPVAPIHLPLAATLDDHAMHPGLSRPSMPPHTPSVHPPPPKSRAWIVIALLAFLLGGAVAAIAMQRSQPKVDLERVAYLENVRGILADGHYVAPPGENVKDLVDQGLRKWPGDTELKRLRSDAEHEMITMAIAARESGDVVGARNLARDAYGLDPTDNSARYMRAQADDDLKGISSGATVNAGAPRLVFESPPTAKPGERVEMTCRVVPGQAGPKAKVSNVRVSLFPNGQTTGGTPVSLSQIDAWNVRALLTAPGAAGSYDVSFEATVDGVVVRAMRDLDVAP